jgi:hypothetical protein
MVRIELDDGWMLLNHQDHARLAAMFADYWGNDVFTKLDPFPLIREGIARHDDAWVERDALPEITPEGFPSAFSKELVGSYDAFEEIDFEAYLRVRGNATEAVAATHPYSAVLISKHTENLLTEQVDIDSLSEEQKGQLDVFIENQRSRQKQLIENSVKTESAGAYVSREHLNSAFRFLQACDSLSLIVCVRFPNPIALRHEHATANGELKQVMCYPMGADRYQLDPYPFSESGLEFEVPFVEIQGKHFDTIEAFRAAVKNGQRKTFTVAFEPKMTQS